MPSIGASLSLCMIVKDEAFFLRGCLAQAAPHLDEIVVADTGSSDDTREIARDFTDKDACFLTHHNYSVEPRPDRVRCGQFL